jgi:hypothetical protein
LPDSTPPYDHTFLEFVSARLSGYSHPHQKKFQRQLKTVTTLGIRYPGLSVRKMSGQTEIWEARIDEHYRFTFQIVDEVMILRRVGTHEIYRKP